MFLSSQRLNYVRKPSVYTQQRTQDFQLKAVQKILRSLSIPEPACLVWQTITGCQKQQSLRCSIQAVFFLNSFRDENNLEN